MPRRARAQRIWFPTSPSFSRLDPWSWERPSLWGLVDGRDCERVTGAGGDREYRDCECRGSTGRCAGMLVAVSQVVSCRSLGGLWGLWVWSIWTVVDRVRKRQGRILQLHDKHRHSFGNRPRSPQRCMTENKERRASARRRCEMLRDNCEAGEAGEAVRDGADKSPRSWLLYCCDTGVGIGGKQQGKAARQQARLWAVGWVNVQWLSLHNDLHTDELS